MPWQPVVLEILRSVAKDLLKEVVKEVANDPDGWALRTSSRLRLEGMANRLRARKVGRRFALPRELDVWRAYARRLPRETAALIDDLATPMSTERLAQRAVLFDPPLRVQLTSSNVRDLAHGLDPQGVDAMKAACNCMDEMQRHLKELGYRASSHKDDESKDATDHGPSRKYRERLLERRERLEDACRSLLEALEVLLPDADRPLANPGPPPS